jgi:hypothetical protein
MKHLRPLLAVAIVALAMALPSIAAAQYNESHIDNFLNSHTRLKAQLSRDPDLIFDKNYRHSHPELQQFMQAHPGLLAKLDRNGRWGAYGPDHNWHEADWWHDHDPDWMYHNHPEWSENHPDWKEDREHHPEWFGGHEGHGQAEEPEHHQTAEEAEHHGEVEGTEQKHGHHDNGNHGDHGNHGDNGNHGDHGNHHDHDDH